MNYRYFAKNFKTKNTGEYWICSGFYNDSEIVFTAKTEDSVREDAYNGLIMMGHLTMDKRDYLLKIVMDRAYKIRKRRESKRFN